MDKKYSKILYMEYVKSNKRAHMPIRDRAAQFAPFAALTGYDDAIKETARATYEKVELDESAKLDLNNKFIAILKNIDSSPRVEITYFVADKCKKGGKYIFYEGVVKKIKTEEKTLILDNDMMVSFDDILTLDGDIFNFEVEK